MNHHKCTLLRDSFSHLPKLLPNSSWKQRIERKLRKLFLVSTNHPEVFNYIKSYAAIEKESKRQIKYKKFIIHPLSDFCKYWNIMMFFLMFIHQLLIAFSIGFYVDIDYDVMDVLIFIDLFICCFLWIEIIISFRSGCIIKETNEIVLDPKIIAKRYLKKNFVPDSIHALPYIYFMRWIIDENNAAINGASIIYMLTLFTFSSYRFSRIKYYFSSIPIMMNLTEKKSIILMICLRTFYFWHWASCMRRLIPLYVEQNPIYYNYWKDSNPTSKFYVRRVNDFNYKALENLLLDDLEEIFSNYTMLNKYTRTMMITLKLTLQSGYGKETSDSILNMLMTTFIMISGWIVATYVLILVSNLMIATAVSSNKFQELMNEIEVFAESKQLSSELRQKVKIFMTRKFQSHYFNEEAIKQSTAVCLRKEIMMHSCSNLVARVSLFKEIPLFLLENIIGCLQFEIYFPNDIIIEANTMGDSMYFIAYGTAAIISSTGVRLQTLCDGSHFGEISLLIKGQKRIATVQALEICEVYKLSQRDFRNIIEPDHELKKRLEQIARERVHKTLIHESTKLSSASH